MFQSKLTKPPRVRPVYATRTIPERTGLLIGTPPPTRGSVNLSGSGSNTPLGGRSGGGARAPRKSLVFESSGGLDMGGPQQITYVPAAVQGRYWTV